MQQHQARSVLARRLTDYGKRAAAGAFARGGGGGAYQGLTCFRRCRSCVATSTLMVPPRRDTTSLVKAERPWSSSTWCRSAISPGVRKLNLRAGFVVDAPVPEVPDRSRRGDGG